MARFEIERQAPHWECPTAVRVLLALSILLISGCDNSSAKSEGPETENSNFRQAMTYQQQGEPRRALECFLKVIDARAESPEAHLEAGRLYLELKDPLPAIYHFKQSIRLKNKPDRTAAVAQLIQTATKAYLQQIPGQPFEPDGTSISVDSAQRISQLQTENSRLKRELEDLYRKNRVTESSPTTGTTFGGFTNTTSVVPNAPVILPAGARSYTVVQGDNLYSISRKMYGVTTRITDIQKANADKLGLGPNPSLKIGMILVIPK